MLRGALRSLDLLDTLPLPPTRTYPVTVLHHYKRRLNYGSFFLVLLAVASALRGRTTSIRESIIMLVIIACLHLCAPYAL